VLITCLLVLTSSKLWGGGSDLVLQEVYIQTSCMNPNALPLGPSLQQVGGVRFGPTRNIYLNLLYESQDCKKWVRSA
jgi:hypothetical protein